MVHGSIIMDPGPGFQAGGKTSQVEVKMVRQSVRRCWIWCQLVVLSSLSSATRSATSNRREERTSSSEGVIADVTQKEHEVGSSLW